MYDFYKHLYKDQSCLLWHFSRLICLLSDWPLNMVLGGRPFPKTALPSGIFIWCLTYSITFFVLRRSYQLYWWPNLILVLRQYLNTKYFVSFLIALNLIFFYPLYISLRGVCAKKCNWRASSPFARSIMYLLCHIW